MIQHAITSGRIKVRTNQFENKDKHDSSDTKYYLVTLVKLEIKQELNAYMQTFFIYVALLKCHILHYI